MKIVITGGNGFLGRYLTNSFRSEGHEVIVLSTHASEEQVYWDGKNSGPWTECLEGTDVLINLAGRSVNCRYTEENKNSILQSRLQSTRVLGRAFSTLSDPPKIWLNASSATVYPHSTDKANTERSLTGCDFSESVVRQWENEFFQASTGTCRKIALRMAIIFDKNGGAFPHYKGLVKKGLGGKQGRGDQKVSFIHVDDVFRIIKFLIHDKGLSGVFNLSSPYPIDNKDMMKHIRKRLGFPIGLPAPALLLALGAKWIGTETELLLKSRFVLPERLLFEGYKFKYPKFSDMLPLLV